MKNGKAKTALSNMFSRAETLFEAWQNLTWSKKVTVWQYVLLCVALITLPAFICTDNIVCGGIGIGSVLGAVFYEFYKED